MKFPCTQRCKRRSHQKHQPYINVHSIILDDKIGMKKEMLIPFSRLMCGVKIGSILPKAAFSPNFDHINTPELFTINRLFAILLLVIRSMKCRECAGWMVHLIELWGVSPVITHYTYSNDCRRRLRWMGHMVYALHLSRNINCNVIIALLLHIAILWYFSDEQMEKRKTKPNVPRNWCIHHGTIEYYNSFHRNNRISCTQVSIAIRGWQAEKQKKDLKIPFFIDAIELMICEENYTSSSNGKILKVKNSKDSCRTAIAIVPESKVSKWLYQ